MIKIKTTLFLFSLFIFLPIVYIFGVGFSIDSFEKLIQSTFNSFCLAIIATFLSFVLALPTAYIFNQKNKMTLGITLLLFLLAVFPPFLISMLFTNKHSFLH